MRFIEPPSPPRCDASTQQSRWDNIPIWLSIVCGIVVVLIGYGWLGDTKGIDWLAFFVSVIFAAILVMIAATVTGGQEGLSANREPSSDATSTGCIARGEDES